MKAGFIRRHLRRRPRSLLLWGLLLVLLIGTSIAVMLAGLALRGDRADAGFFYVLGLFAALLAVGVALIGWSVRLWRRLDRHPSVLALARYGPPGEVVTAIDAELAGPKQVLRIGRRLRSFRLDLGGARDLYGEVLLTPSWLVCLGDEGQDLVGVQQLESVVWAYRAADPSPAALLSLGRCEAAVIVDRHGVGLRIPGTEAGVTRLLAEILTRVPWALSRFDEETQRAWNDDRERIIADVDRRRDQIR
jgi:hypothetical protein